MLKLVRQLATDNKRAIVMVTHDLRDCEAIADSHHAIENSRLVAKRVQQNSTGFS